MKCIEDEIPFEIPESWGWGRLGELVYNHGQRRPSADFSYIDISSIDNQHQRLSCEENILSSEKAPSRARKIVAYGDILYSTVRPYLHNMCIIDRIFSKQPIASTGFAVLTCHDDFFNEFLFYYMMSPDFDTYVNHTDNAKGVAYPSISDTRLYHALIPIPPAREQRDIVSAVKRLIHYINKYNIARNQLNRLMSNFPNAMKHSILQWAVQGKLVQQDESDEPASVLLDRIRAKKKELIKEGKLKKDKHESIIFRRDNSYYERLDDVERCIDDEIPFEIPNHWHWERMGNISFITKLAGFEYTKYISPAITAKGIPLLKGKNVKNSIFVENFESYIPESISDFLNRSQLAKKCILTPYVGSIGNVAIFHGNYKAHLGSNIGKIELYTTDLLEEYVVRYLHSNTGYEQLIKHKKATAQDSISMAALRDVLIPLPPTFEQERIIDKINNILSLVKKQ